MLDLLPLPNMTEPQTPAVEFRPLTPAEIQTIKSVFTERGHSLPDPMLSTVVGAVKSGRVVGFLVLQYRLHAEPMWIEEGNSDLFTSLVRTAEQTVLSTRGPSWVYLMAPEGKVSKLAEAMGMEKEPLNTYTKLVSVRVPDKGLMDEILPVEYSLDLRDDYCTTDDVYRALLVEDKEDINVVRSE